MLKIVGSSWPLFFGYALLMIGNGLQGTLLGVRASIEDFNPATIGFIMSLYYLGYLAGSYYAPRLVSRVGHIRVFTALASLASITVLLHGVYAEPWFWALMRVITGFSYAGLFIVVESWLNNSSNNKTRGVILGMYQVVGYGGMVIGQYFLNIADPSTINLFIVTSILVSIALLPISLSTRPAPSFEEPETLPLKQLFKISPLGVIGVFTIGMAGSMVFGYGAVYAKDIGMTLPQISTFMAFYILGGALFQMPIGWLSDRFDRRIILIAISFISFCLSMTCYFSSSSHYFLTIAIFFFGGFSLCTYGLSMAHITDHLTPKQYVGASASAILLSGMGAVIGPFGISIILSLLGNNYFFITTAIIFFIYFIYGLYRTTRREPVPLDQQGDYNIMPVRSTPMTMAITEEGREILDKMKDE